MPLTGMQKGDAGRGRVVHANIAPIHREESFCGSNWLKGCYKRALIRESGVRFV